MINLGRIYVLMECVIRHIPYFKALLSKHFCKRASFWLAIIRNQMALYIITFLINVIVVMMMMSVMVVMMIMAMIVVVIMIMFVVVVMPVFMIMFMFMSMIWMMLLMAMFMMVLLRLLSCISFINRF